MGVTARSPETQDLEVSFLAEGMPGAVELRFYEPGFGVQLPTSSEPVVLMLQPGQEFDVTVAICAPRRLVARAGTYCVVEHRSSSGSLVAGVRIEGAVDPSDEAITESMRLGRVPEPPDGSNPVRTREGHIVSWGRER